jgi:hypothetical protein
MVDCLLELQFSRNQMVQYAIIILMIGHGANVHLEAGEENELSADEHGSEKRYERVSGMTPLHFAVKMGYRSIVKLLHESDAR